MAESPYAFPREKYGCENQPGMTLRDYFAGQVVAGHPQGTLFSDPPALARHAYNIADAMLAERKARETSHAS